MCSNRHIRGGSWNNNANNCTVSNRNNNNPDNRNNNNGFRLARSSGTVVDATRDSRTGSVPVPAESLIPAGQNPTIGARRW
jgi:predicted lipoprotein